MELKKYQFSVNTADKCFLCFGEADFSNFNSLGNILHCLKINLTELHSLSSKSPSLLNKTDFKIRLCSECGLIIQKFSKEYETLVVYKMKVASTLEVIKKRLTQVMPEVESFKEEDTKFLKHCKIVEELRTEMVKKCEIKIDHVLPKVIIKKIILKDMELKPVTPSDSAPIEALEIKLEPTKDADNFEEDFIFKNDFQTETVETESLKTRPKFRKRLKKQVEKNSSNHKILKKKYCKRKVKQTTVSTSEPIVALEIKSEHIHEDTFEESIFTDFQTETVTNPMENSKIIENEFNFYCKICGERFINRIALFSHEKTHKNPDELFYCFCGAGCSSEERLRIHQRRVHSDKNLPCSICSRTFPSKTMLRNHKKTHFEPRPFKCTFKNCGMTYAKKDRLANHMKVHSEEFPWKCQRCGKSFPFKAKLQRHSQIHKVQRSRINCNLCQASFLHRKNLIIHSRNAHGLPLEMIETSVENYVTNGNPSELFFDT